MRLLTIDPLALDLWDPLAEHDATPPGERAPVTVVVWRKGFALHHRHAVPDETRCLEHLMTGGCSLADVGELLLAPDRAAEQTAERFASLLDLWLSNELLTQRNA